MTSSPDDTTNLLRDSLAEAQATVRSYDTKAQIVGVGYIFALGVVFRFNEVLPKVTDIDVVAMVAAWAIIIVPILLFGFVLHPTRRTAPRLLNEPTSKLRYILYVDPVRYTDLEQLVTSANTADPAHEIGYELLRVSKLRELKRHRFLRALFAAGICFLVLFGSQVSRAYGTGLFG